MKKKIIATILVALSVLATVGCGKKNTGNESVGSDKTSELTINEDVPLFSTEKEEPKEESEEEPTWRNPHNVYGNYVGAEGLFDNVANESFYFTNDYAAPSGLYLGKYKAVSLALDYSGKEEGTSEVNGICLKQNIHNVEKSAQEEYDRLKDIPFEDITLEVKLDENGEVVATCSLFPGVVLQASEIKYANYVDGKDGYGGEKYEWRVGNRGEDFYLQEYVDPTLYLDDGIDLTYDGARAPGEVLSYVEENRTSTKTYGIHFGLIRSDYKQFSVNVNESLEIEYPPITVGEWHIFTELCFEKIE